LIGITRQPAALTAVVDNGETDLRRVEATGENRISICPEKYNF
jgi:hypothetical protein